MKILQAGCGEFTKAAVHGTIGTLAAVCALYSAAALVERHSWQRHLTRNLVLYTGLAILEYQHVTHHWRCGR